MGKAELINQESTDRKRWPVEARICEHIWNLSKKMRESNLMQEYLDGTCTKEQITIYLKEKDTSNMLKDIIDLKHVCSIMLPDITPNSISVADSDCFKVLSKIGTILANSLWHSRYEAITGTMGITCVLSIRTAQSLFKRDPLADELINELSQLIKETV